MNDEWSPPTAEHERPALHASTAANDGPPDGPSLEIDVVLDPVLGVTEGDLRIFEAYCYEQAVEDAEHRGPPTPEQQETNAKIMEHIRWLTSTPPEEVARIRREKGRR